jgi:HECT-domain (ubiquitin-transferase)
MSYNFAIFFTVDDLRANTEYSGYSIASPVIQWFWEVVQSFSKEDKARFLQFVTGTSKVCLSFTFPLSLELVLVVDL